MNLRTRVVVIQENGLTERTVRSLLSQPLWGEGVKKSEIFADIINGSPLTPAAAAFEINWISDIKTATCRALKCLRSIYSANWMVRHRWEKVKLSFPLIVSPLPFCFGQNEHRTKRVKVSHFISSWLNETYWEYATDTKKVCWLNHSKKYYVLHTLIIFYYVLTKTEIKWGGAGASCLASVLLET